MTNTEIQKLNFYGWTYIGMDENPKNVLKEDVFILRKDVEEIIAKQQLIQRNNNQNRFLIIPKDSKFRR